MAAFYLRSCKAYISVANLNLFLQGINIIGDDEFLKLFEYYKFQLGEYNASGYVLSKKDYPKFDEVYSYYTESFV